MAMPNLLHKNVPRADLDQRAREARIRIERLERLLVPRVEAPQFWQRPLVRLATFRFNGNDPRNGQTGSALIGQQPDRMIENESVSADRVGSDARSSDARKSPAVAAGRRGSAGDGYTDPSRSGKRAPAGYDRHRPRPLHDRACLREELPAAAAATTVNRVAMSGLDPRPLLRCRMHARLLPPLPHPEPLLLCPGIRRRAGPRPARPSVLVAHLGGPERALPCATCAAQERQWPVSDFMARSRRNAMPFEAINHQSSSPAAHARRHHVDRR